MSGANVDNVFDRVETKVKGLLDENAQLREQNRVLRQLVQDVVNSGVAFEDGRIPYKEVQIDRMWFDDAQAALTATTPEEAT